MQQDRVHYVEEGGIRPNPQRQGQYRDSAESRAVEQHAQPMPNVLPECIHIVLPISEQPRNDCRGPSTPKGFHAWPIVRSLSAPFIPSLPPPDLRKAIYGRLSAFRTGAALAASWRFFPRAMAKQSAP